jgi:nucleoside-diphosphate-sugar epimerase
MNVFIAGSTGVLGRRLVEQFVGRGHAVVALVRSPDGEQRVASLGAQARYADIFDARGLVHAAQGAEVVIHAATAIPNKPRTTARDWEQNDRIRRAGTEALAECAGQIGAKLFIFQSIVWLASPADGSQFDETAPPRPTAITQSALDGERIAQDAAQRHGFAVCVLRCSWFYGADSAHTKLFGRELMRRRMPIIGKGDAVWSWLHLDDAADAFVTAAEAGQAGLWHVTDNEPVTARDSLRGFAERLGARPPRTVPVWLARLLAGRDAVEFLTETTRATNARFRRDFDWSPKYPTYREGYDQIVAAWQGRTPQP